MQRLFAVTIILTILSGCSSIASIAPTVPPVKSKNAHAVVAPVAVVTREEEVPRMATVTPSISVVPLTFTPGPTATPRTVDAVCPIVATRTPHPDQSHVSDGPGKECISDPHVEICLSAIEARVGETLRVQGQAVNMGMPSYELYERETGTANFVSLGWIDYNGQSNFVDNTNSLLEITSAQTEHGKAVSFLLRVRKAGTVELHLTASGEVGCGAGPWTWAGGGSDEVHITMNP